MILMLEIKNVSLYNNVKEIREKHSNLKNSSMANYQSKKKKQPAKKKARLSFNVFAGRAHVIKVALNHLCFVNTVYISIILRQSAQHDPANLWTISRQTQAI